MILTGISGYIMADLVINTGLAVLMSTLDSQLCRHRARFLHEMSVALNKNPKRNQCYRSCFCDFSTFLPFIWVLMIIFCISLIPHAIILSVKNASKVHLQQWLYDRFVWILLGIFILAMDFWS